MTIVAISGIRAGDGTASTAGTTLTVTNTTAQIIPAGTLVHIAGSWDNIASVTAPTITCSTIGGATAIANHATAVGSGVTTTAGSGIWHACFRAVTTAAVAVGAVLATLTSDQSAVKRAAYAVGWSGALATLRGTVATGVSTTGAPTVTTTGTALVVGDLVIGSVSFENSALMTSDGDTAGGSWTPIIGTFTTGGAAGTNVGAGVQCKVLTGTGTQTFNPTGGVADTVACVYAVQPAPPQAITQAAYRFYADDNTDTLSTALAAQNTAYTVNLSADVNLQVRVLLQSTNATTIPATDDFQLQYEKNASGTWLPVSAVSSVVTAFASVSIAEGQTITNRLTGGTGAYATGKGSTDGLVDNLGWTGNNYTELLYAITLKQADLANGDTVRLRITDSNTEPVFTYTQVPTIPIVKQAITQAAYRFYANGSEAGSTALAAQDTAYTANVSAGDASLQLRTRLQSTTLADISALSDFRLQWEKNASGTWTDVAIPTPTLSDTYPDSNWTNRSQASMGVDQPRVGQSFLGNGQALSRVGFVISPSGTPDGTVTAVLYAHTGTFGGTDGIPTGAALATSTTTVPPSVLIPAEAWAYFDFDGTFTLANGTPYFVVLATTTTASTGFTIPVDDTLPTHPGRFAIYTTPTGPWSSTNDSDLFFEIYTKPTSAPTTVLGNTSSLVTLADSYAESNFDNTAALYLNHTQAAQSFLGNGQALSRAGFFIDRFNTPNGTVTAVLYAHTGTFGAAGSKPTGAALASSSTVRNASSYSEVIQWCYFDFDGTFTLTSGTPYFIALVGTNTANIANTIEIARDASSPSHAGTAALFDTASWIPDSADLMFRVYTQPLGSTPLADGAPTTNRLTGGTGTFQAGEVALDGQVDDLGWTGNNYTELLYAITLLKANLADSDTLRFRVLRNGSTVGQTYTLTPTIPITVGAPATTASGSISITGSSAAAAATAASGSISITGTAASARAAATATGSVAITGTAGATAVAAATGSIAITGTAPAPAIAIGASGSIAITGLVAAPPVAAAASGSISITGATTARAATVASGSISITATAAGAATAAASGSIAITGTAPSTLAAAASGSIAITGTAAAPAIAIGASGSIAITGTAPSTLAVAATGSIAITGTAAGQAVAAATGSFSITGTTPSTVAVAASGSISITGAVAVGAPAAASGSISITGTASSSLAAAATGSISITGTAAVATASAATGSISITGTAATQARAAASGSISITGTAPPSAGTAAIGSIAITGTATTGAATATSGSITITGTGTPPTSTPAAATGSIAITGNAATRAAATAGGSIAITGTAGPSPVVATATGSITIAGNVAAQAGSAATGLITITGTAAPAAGVATAGSIALIGAAGTAAAVSVSGSITIDGSATTAARTVAAGSIAITGVAGTLPKVNITLTVGPTRTRAQVPKLAPTTAMVFGATRTRAQITITTTRSRTQANVTRTATTTTLGPTRDRAQASIATTTSPTLIGSTRS